MSIRPRFLLSALCAGLAFFCFGPALRGEKIPPAPERYFNDYAGVVSGQTAAALDRQLENYERQSSNQLLVAVYPKMDSESSLEDYTNRIAQSWRVGQKARNNGAVLFVFVQDRAVRIEVGYGLEPKLTDATSFQIIQEQILPQFRSGNYARGLAAGVQAMIAASQGEFTGSGRTVADRQGYRSHGNVGALPIAIFFLAMILFSAFSRRGQRQVLRNPRRGIYDDRWPPTGGFGGFGGGGGGGSSGGFSGGGGSFGGGGASGRW